MSDLKLTQQNDGFWDLTLTNGDFTLTEGFDSSLIVSLFADARADFSEVVVPELRRGFWGDETNDNPEMKLGSKIWLLEQARRTSLTLNRLNDYTYQALQWLLDQNYSEDIKVTSSFLPTGARLNITITNSAGASESSSFNIWQNTGL